LYQQINSSHLVKHRFCWNCGTSAGGTHLWKDESRVFVYRNWQVQSYSNLFYIVLCETELNSFAFNGLYKSSAMKIIWYSKKNICSSYLLISVKMCCGCNVCVLEIWYCLVLGDFFLVLRRNYV
jgi:hypothetical protein